ncbi:hypothetical protein J2X69_002086 [Algoriphagus sp. 4150]|uniref:hypothetical protein n=1 Tax=Algoriphagus sp. 4150 TaxID=2817756 RepID=UPI0028597587|nr:hypothetical protein [Algoriphagus sp. 4150]MDR7129741.1 hypothetical protein [Algoriphagus sp. 4150]
MKNPTTIIAYLSLLCLNFTSCSKDDNEPVLSEGTPLTTISLSVKDSNGNDLLNPSHGLHFPEENISFEHIKYNGNEISSNAKIIKRPNSELYLLLLETNLNVINNKSKIVIHWNTHLSDTLEIEFLEHLSQAKRISVNDTPIWNHLQASSLPPTIIK